MAALIIMRPAADSAHARAIPRWSLVVTPWRVRILSRPPTKVATRMALAVLAYYVTGMMSILGVRPVMAACAPAAAVVDQAAPCSQSALHTRPSPNADVCAATSCIGADPRTSRSDNWVDQEA